MVLNRTWLHDRENNILKHKTTPVPQKPSFTLNLWTMRPMYFLSREANRRQEMEPELVAWRRHHSTMLASDSDWVLDLRPCTLFWLCELPLYWGWGDSGSYLLETEIQRQILQPQHIWVTLERSCLLGPLWFCFLLQLNRILHVITSVVFDVMTRTNY